MCLNSLGSLVLRRHYVLFWMENKGLIPSMPETKNGCRHLELQMVVSVTRKKIFLPKDRHRDPTLPKLAIQVRLLETTATQQCIPHHREEVHQKKMSIQLSVHHRCCNGVKARLWSHYWQFIGVPPQPKHQRPGGLAMLLYRHTTGGPPRRRIQTAFGGGYSRRELCKRPYAKMQLEHRASKSPQWASLGL